MQGKGKRKDLQGFEGQIPKVLPPKKRQVARKTGPPPKKTPSPKPIKKAPTKKRKGFEVNSKTFLLTFPQWEGQETLDQLQQKLFDFWTTKNKEVVESIIAIEDHGPQQNARGHTDGEDPGKHIHMCFKLNKPHDVRNQDFFDELVGKHCNIQSCRDYKACQIYCNKDGNVICHNVDIDAVVKSTKSKKGVQHETVANYIRKKDRSMLEVDIKYPGYMIQHQRKVSDYIKLQYSFKNGTKPYPGIGNVIGRSPCIIELVSWLNKNLPPQPRPFKQKQLWLWGPPNMGKTTLRMDLSQWFIPYNVVLDEDRWWSGLDHSKQIAFFEEFSGTKTLSAMKSFLDGSPMSIAVKGETYPFEKTKNIPCIILSNKHPDEVYSEARLKSELAYQGLIERLVIIKVDEFIKIPWNKPAEELEQEEESDSEDVPSTPPTMVRSNAGTNLAQTLILPASPEAGSDPLECDEEVGSDPYEVNEEDEDPYNQDEHSEMSVEQHLERLKKIHKKNN